MGLFLGPECSPQNGFYPLSVRPACLGASCLLGLGSEADYLVWPKSQVGVHSPSLMPGPPCVWQDIQMLHAMSGSERPCSSQTAGGRIGLCRVLPRIVDAHLGESWAPGNSFLFTGRDGGYRVWGQTGFQGQGCLCWELKNVGEGVLLS